MTWKIELLFVIMTENWLIVLLTSQVVLGINVIIEQLTVVGKAVVLW